MLQLHLEEQDTYQPSSQESDSLASSSSDLSDGAHAENDSKVYWRMKLNEFLHCCNVPTVGPSKKRWVETSMRTRKSHIAKAKDLVVAGCELIAPGDGGHLWEALRDSGAMEKEFGIAEET